VFAQVREANEQAEWGHSGPASAEFPAFVAVLRSHWCMRLHVFGQPSMENRSRKAQVSQEHSTRVPDS
jgi:hypothetical protein